MATGKSEGQSAAPGEAAGRRIVLVINVLFFTLVACSFIPGIRLWTGIAGLVVFGIIVLVVFTPIPDLLLRRGTERGAAAAFRTKFVCWSKPKLLRIDGVTEHVEEQFLEIRPSLLAGGFQRVGNWKMTDSVDIGLPMAHFMELWWHSPSSTVAVLNKFVEADKVSPKGISLVMHTSNGDGTCIQTSSAATGEMLPDPPSTVVVRFPDELNAGELHRLHLALLTKLAPNVIREDIAAKGWEQWILRERNAGIENLVNQGYLTPPGSDGTQRLTRDGANLLASNLLANSGDDAKAKRIAEADELRAELSA